MEKLVLSNGYEFDLVPNGVHGSNESVTFTCVKGDYTAEQLFAAFTGNREFKVKSGDTAIRVFENYTHCNQLTITKDYVIEVHFVCPECGVQVAPTATTCDACNAAFEAPTAEDVRADVFCVICRVPNINDRMNDAENAIEDIIDTILG